MPKEMPEKKVVSVGKSLMEREIEAKAERREKEEDR